MYTLRMCYGCDESSYNQTNILVFWCLGQFKIEFLTGMTNSEQIEVLRHQGNA